MITHLPAVYRFADLGETLDYLLHNEHLYTLLIFCSTREVFLQQLITSGEPNRRGPGAHLAGEDSRDAQGSSKELNTREILRTRTTRRIIKAETIKVAFCTSVPALHAYLSTLPQTSNRGLKHDTTTKKTRPPLLMLVNPIALHKDTASYSAQGLSRAFAAAFEAALRSSQQLVIVEYALRKPRSARAMEADGLEYGDTEMLDPHQEEHNHGGIDKSEDEVEELDPWEQEVPILNATTRTFGIGGSSLVLGRTVKVKAVASRWCTFHEGADAEI
jgi:hypothetical protein